MLKLLAEARQTLIPHENGMSFCMLPHRLYCNKYWFLGNAERGTSKFPKSKKQFPGIPGEYLGNSWGMHNIGKGHISK